MRSTLALFLTLLLLAPGAAAESLTAKGQAAPDMANGDATVSFLSKRTQFSLDVTAGGASVGFAQGRSTGRLVGVCVGVGGDPINYMVIAGRHFAEGPAYEPKDGYTGKRLFEILHIGFFLRSQPSHRWQYDVGVRGSLFAYWDSSDDDPGGGHFLGGYGDLYFGGRHIKVGPRVLVGRFRCDGVGGPEFGINISPLTVRILAAW